ncbi:SHOCT domain-containing protein [Planomonospora sp. ID82291]|uniref:SHOCT domain-containing protein n=1 Tax=Planomonospora sp. ID82291 TaxID=2738136 RepID=UPI0018C38D9D|nr:SHOCT domain-containing protein [Planomonospora sp. ID82291]MBG0817165.1 SHOCT domain-containing protein [Planomonospora sp. ID82291]
MDDYPLLDLFWTMFMFFMWILWFMLLFRIIGDLFRDDTVGGWGKTGWTVVLVLLPFAGVLVYLIARGRGMGEREMARLRASQEAFRSYVRETAAESGAAGSGTADELVRLADLKRRGDITGDEYEQAKSKVLAGV